MKLFNKLIVKICKILKIVQLIMNKNKFILHKNNNYNNKVQQLQNLKEKLILKIKILIKAITITILKMV